MIGSRGNGKDQEEWFQEADAPVQIGPWTGHRGTLENVTLEGTDCDCNKRCLVVDERESSVNPCWRRVPTEREANQWTERASEKREGERTEVSSGKMITPERRLSLMYLNREHEKNNQGGWK